MKTSVILAATLLTACYGAAPPRPVNVALPRFLDDAAMEVHSETKTTIERVPTKSETCPQGVPAGSPTCTVTTGTALEPVTRTTTQMQYAGAPINYGQFLVMTNPSYQMQLGKLEELSHVCTRANVPRYVGMALVLTGLIAGPIVAKNNGTAGSAILYGGLGTGGASYTLGFFAFGGRECNQARGLYRELDMSQRMSDTVYGGTRALEIQVLADQFNARLRGRTSMQMRSE